MCWPRCGPPRAGPRARETSPALGGQSGEAEVGWGRRALCGGLCFQPCDSGAYAVLAELRRCGLTDSETCLKSLTLSLGHTVSAGRAGVPPGKRPLRGL